MNKSNSYFSEIMYTIHEENTEKIEKRERELFNNLSDAQHEYLLALKISFFEAGFACGKTNKSIDFLFKKIENYDKI